MLFETEMVETNLGAKEQPTMKTRSILAMAVAAGTMGLAGTARAVTVDNLAHLASDPNNSLTVDDKLFDNFGYQVVGLSSFDPSGILVTASALGGFEDLTWTGNMSIAGPPGTTGELLLTYTVTALNGLITSIDQFFVGNSVPGGTGILEIDELVLDPSNNASVASSHLEVNDIVDPPGELLQGDNLDVVPPLGKVNVMKDIGMGITNPNGGLVTVTVSRQSFHQVPAGGTPVTESGTTALLLSLALTGLGLVRKSVV